MLVLVHQKQRNYQNIKKAIFEDTKKGFKVYAKHNYDNLKIVIDEEANLKLAHGDIVIPRKPHRSSTNKENELKNLIKKS